MAGIRSTQVSDAKAELLFAFINLLELHLHHQLEGISEALEKGCADVILEVTTGALGTIPAVALRWAFCCTLKSCSTHTENLMNWTGPLLGMRLFPAGHDIMLLQANTVVSVCLNQAGCGKHR